MQYATDNPSGKVPLVSVLMPLYNCEAYVLESLRSLAAQTMADFEAILVNDGSIDQTGRIIEDFAAGDHRFRIVHQANQGIVGALNNGLALVRGKYIARLDGDDLAHTERFKLQAEYLDNHPACVCVGSLYRTINEHGALTWVQKVFSNVKQTDLSVFPPRITTLPHPSIMLRTESLRAINGYRQHFPHAEDFDMYLRLSRIGRLEIIPQHLLDYRVHSSSLSERNFQRQFNSSYLALLAATVCNSGQPDPFVGTNDVDEQALYRALKDPQAVAFLSWYRELLLTEAWMNRSHFVNAKRELKDLFSKIFRGFYPFAADRRYWALMLASAKFWLKIDLQRMRSVGES